MCTAALGKSINPARKIAPKSGPFQIGAPGIVEPSHAEILYGDSASVTRPAQPPLSSLIKVAGQARRKPPSEPNRAANADPSPTPGDPGPNAPYLATKAGPGISEPVAPVPAPGPAGRQANAEPEGGREGLKGNRAAFSDRIGRWPKDRAWKEIQDGMANPNATMNPTYEEARIWAIQNNRAAVFDIKDDPNVDDSPAPHRVHAKGFSAIARHDAIIVREARKQGVDPDLVRAIMYVENADGNPVGLNKAAESFGMADTIFPMNINPRIWAGMGGVGRKEFGQPDRNIRAGVALIKVISDRLRVRDRTPMKIGSIWSFTGRENVNYIGARIQRAYDGKYWKSS